MRVDECYQLGYIIKTHGLKGDVNVRLDVDNPEEYRKLESVFIREMENLVPFFIQSIKIQDNRAIIKFEEVDTVEMAGKLVGRELMLPIELLPDLPKGEFYYHDLVGVSLFEGRKKLGVINSIYQPSSQYLASIEIEGKEVLIPIDDSIFIKVDLTKKKAQVKLPEGLLDIYLKES